MKSIVPSMSKKSLKCMLRSISECQVYQDRDVASIISGTDVASSVKVWLTEILMMGETVTKSFSTTGIMEGNNASASSTS